MPKQDEPLNHQPSEEETHLGQNIVSLNYTDADLTAIDEALAGLEQKPAPLIGLSPDERRSLVKMGDESDAFCRGTLMVLAVR